MICQSTFPPKIIDVLLYNGTIYTPPSRYSYDNNESEFIFTRVMAVADVFFLR